MHVLNSTRKTRGYCSLCKCWCPVVSHVMDGVFIKVVPDDEHPLACGICVKAEAGPELVYTKERLRYPMRRTRPKGDPDPGWQRITWDEALNATAAKLNEIKATFGPEAVAVSSAAPGGSPMGEVNRWVDRLAHAFGTPNHMYPTHICQWSRDKCSAYTYGSIGSRDRQGLAEYERSACILIWGNDTHATRHSLITRIERGMKQGAKLIVIDPRKTEIAAMADLWLPVCPGTDGALALSMINILIDDKLFDHDFVRDWTTAPFLVRSDTGDFLKASDLTVGADQSSYVIIDSRSEKPKAYAPGAILQTEPILDSKITFELVNGKEIECSTVFRLLSKSTEKYSLQRTETVTGVPKEKIRDAARMFATNRPSCWYSYTGIEQNINSGQTNRAICILYALTGNYDKPGGNVLFPKAPVNTIDGHEFLSPEVERKRLGFEERPLGPSGVTSRMAQGYEFNKAALSGKPYPIKALLNFGRSLTTGNIPAKETRLAISQLDFHIDTALFLSPSTQFADIVLPAASSWESWHVGVNFHPFGEKAYIQLRPAVVPPQHESLPDIEIVFELAKRLGLGDKFWDGDIEAAFNYHLAPANITVEQLRIKPGGIAVDLPMEYQKHRKKDNSGTYLGFPTSSKRVEIYSSLFKEYGYDPLPTWKKPLHLRSALAKQLKQYPLILTSSKVVEYCHAQHRALPSLRKRVPYPFLEINTLKASELGLKNGDWLLLATAHGSITLQAKLTDGIPYNVVCTQNGWWQACPELNLPGYDPYASEGANQSLLYVPEEIDPISGSFAIKGYPCSVERA